MLTDLKLPKITYKRATNYKQGRTEPVRAMVNHRMVGTLAGTDAYFTKPDAPAVSTHFGIGYGDNGVVQITQYVPLDDTAFANGNYDPSGAWDNWGYKTTEINAQTISIEHQDHRDPAGKGVVSAKTQEASQKLQALLLRGTIADWKAAGIKVRDWDNNAPILKRELSRIEIDGEHIIDHHNIAGDLKPYCWRPWQNDKVGFPKTEYIRSIREFVTILQAPPVVVEPPPPPPPPVTYTQEQVDALIAAATDLVKLEYQDDILYLTGQLNAIRPFVGQKLRSLAEEVDPTTP